MLELRLPEMGVLVRLAPAARRLVEPREVGGVGAGVWLSGTRTADAGGGLNGNFSLIATWSPVLASEAVSPVGVGAAPVGCVDSPTLSGGVEGRRSIEVRSVLVSSV